MAPKARTFNATRRTFLKEIATAAAGAASGIALEPAVAQPAGGGGNTPVQSPVRRDNSASQQSAVRIRMQDDRLAIETSTLTAVIQKGFITTLKSKATGEEFIKGFDLSQSTALQLIYPSEEVVGIGETKFGNISCRMLSDDRAEVIFRSWDGDGVLAVSGDPETGDLILEPSGYSSRPGVRACRWNIKGLREDCELVAPFFQGAKLKLEDSLIRGTRWTWPRPWEAGLAMIQSSSGGFWIHAQDNRYRYKALQVGSKADAHTIGVDSEAYGPIDGNLSAGGLAWRINVYQGDWKVPAARYRDWLWSAYNLQGAEKARQPWIYGLKFALSWCPGDPEVLDALAKRFDPRTVLLHFSNWRTDPYDENYPTFVESEKARAFIAKGQAMGFHIMPHCNSIDMDPMHSVYDQVRDFQYRDLETKQLRGWSWYKGAGIGVPESNNNRRGHRDKKVMVKIHPGLSMWRSILGENILKAANDLSLEAVFVDVTLNTTNLHNCLVEATTSTEGMKRLIEHVGRLGKGLSVGGEGLNEVTAQGLSFAQAHLFQSYQRNVEGVERTGGCAFNEFLLGKLCRTIGYSGLGGRNADEELRIRLHEEHGAIPTLTIRSAKELTDPNPVAKRVLERAAAGHM